MSWIDKEKAIEDLQNGDPSQLYDLEDIKYWLNCLPSAQSETNCSEFPNNSDTISRQAAIEAEDSK